MELTKACTSVFHYFCPMLLGTDILYTSWNTMDFFMVCHHGYQLSKKGQKSDKSGNEVRSVIGWINFTIPRRLESCFLISRKKSTLFPSHGVLVSNLFFCLVIMMDKANKTLIRLWYFDNKRFYTFHTTEHVFKQHECH